MALSKKIRFEVFKRDSFQCCYCGRKPPEVVLECDHITPKSKCGEDDIDNLITACFDCNRGKGATELNQVPPGVKEKLMLQRERQEQLDEYNSFLQQAKLKLYENVEECAFYFEYCCDCEMKLTDAFKYTTLKNFCRKLAIEEIKEAMDIAEEKFGTIGTEDAVKYFCGICWKKIRGGR